MIDGHTQLVGLLGWPVEHSLSPAMHNAAFEAFGLNWRYLPLPVRPGEVEQAVRGLAALGFQGANVTVPHKRAVFPALASLSPAARALGAVNTLVVQRADDRAPTVHGANTDADGFVGALRHGGCAPTDTTTALVVGAGGAARGVVYGLLAAGTGRVVVLNRGFERALLLVQDLAGQDDGWASRLSALSLSAETLVETARGADLLVHATTVGMWPRTEGSVWPDGIPLPAHLAVFDLVYNPLETHLLRQARESGAHPIDGLGMLVRQGALSFDLWTERDIPIDEIDRVMRSACEQVLGVGHNGVHQGRSSV
jgi:shikimate dehydrogenase